MRTYLLVLQIVIAALLIASIILQGGGAGLGNPFGGGGESFKTRRGVEKTLFYVTIALAVVFVASVIAGLLL
jgi:preprotein translocase subunit SecG